MPSIAGQDVEELGGAGSVLVRQQRDHIAPEVLLREVLGTVADRWIAPRLRSREGRVNH